MNVYESDDDRAKFQRDYYTKKGVNALEHRLKSLVGLYLKQKVFPCSFMMLGFPRLKVHSKEHLEGMIDDLCQILGVKNVHVIYGEDKNGES